MINYAVLTDKGCREVNEDSVSVYQKDDDFCFVLCDGLGGHGMGDEASQLVVKSFGNSFDETDFDIKKFLPEAFEKAQNELMSEQAIKRASSKMKTTCVAAITDGKKLAVGHVGDSRLYYFSKGKVLKRTLDHSIPQMLVLTKDIKESEIRHHPQRSLILRVMGTPWEKPMYDLEKIVSIRKCQAILLCSDGFWELVEEDEMCELLSSTDSPLAWLKELEKKVKEHGSGTDMDNYSAIAVWFSK